MRSPDGQVTLSMKVEEDERLVATYAFALTTPGEPTMVARLPKGATGIPLEAFRGSNVVGLRADATLGFGDFGHIVWATIQPRAIAAHRVKGSVVIVRSKLYFNDLSCVIHEIDVDTGKRRTLPMKACDQIVRWGDALVLGKARYVDTGTSHVLTGFDFGDVVIDPSTGRRLPPPGCPHPVGAGCITFDGDLHTEIEEDPPAANSSPSTLSGFEVRGPNGEAVRGQTQTPHHGLSPNHATLWQEAGGGALAFVAASVDGGRGPHLVVLDRARLSITPISSEDEIDQRRLATLATFVPLGTPAAEVDELVRARRAALSAAESDRVRFVPYPQALSANLPCTAPPP